MDKNIIKKKNDLLKSIMSNPKMSKTFREAMMAPIGSTKRQQAKTVLSIMKKLGGTYSDGQGGPFMNPQQTPSAPVTPDYSNMVIFPAAPKFKTKTPKGNVSAPVANDGQGGPYNSFMNNPYSYSPTTASKLEAPTGPIPGAGLWDAIVHPKQPERSLTSGTSTPLFGGAFSGYKPPAEIESATRFFGVPKTNWPTLSAPTKTKEDTSTAPPSPEGLQDKTQAMLQGIQDVLQKQKTSTGTSPTDTTQTGGTESPEGTTTGGGATPPTPITEKPMSEGDRIKSEAKKAVEEGTGAGLFAMGIADEKFEGGLDAYINKLDTKLKTDFNLDALETELSNLKSQKNNLIPTLTQYVQGKDNYLKFVDQMIDRTEGELLKTDIGNPAVANSYNNYLKYLYTLKGRQTQRYGNFLESAVADYNSDLERTESNYTNVYNRYNAAITRQSGIAQNDYNTLYQTMASLYTSLEEAPTKRLNLEILQQQKTLNNLKIIETAGGLDGGSGTLDYGKVQEYAKSIADKDGNLSMEALGADGLAGHLMAAKDKNAMIKAINTAVATSLSPKEGGAGETDRVSQAFKFKKLIDDLASVPGGETYAAKMYPTFNQNANDLVSNYVLGNIDSIKSATKDLVTESKPWFSKNKKPGLEDKETWKESYSDLDSNLLDSLYNLTNNVL